MYQYLNMFINPYEVHLYAYTSELRKKTTKVNSQYLLSYHVNKGLLIPKIYSISQVENKLTIAWQKAKNDKMPNNSSQNTT